MATISINQFNKRTGGISSVSSISQEQKQQSGSSNFGFFSGMKDTIGSLGKFVTEDIPRRAGNISSAVTKAARTGTPRDVLSAGLSVPGQLAAMPFDVLGRAVEPVAEQAQQIADSPEVLRVTQGIRDKLEGAVVDYLNFKRDNPQFAQDIGNLFNIVGALTGAKASTKMSSPAIRSVETGVETAKKSFVDSTINIIKNVGGKAEKIKQYSVSRVPKLLGIFSGESDDVISNALRNPQAAQAALNSGDDALRYIVNEGATNSVKIRDAFISGHREAVKSSVFDGISVSSGYAKMTAQEVKKAFGDYLRANRVSSKNGALDFTTSSMKANQGEISKVQAAFDAVNGWKNWSPQGVHELKQLIGQYTKFATEFGGSSKSPMLGRFYNYLNAKIKESLPKNKIRAYEDLNRKFSDSIDLYNDMVDAFNSGDPFTKLAGALGKNRDSLRQVIKFYEEQTGKNNVLATVAGRELGLEKTAAFGFLNPRSWIDFFISPEHQGRIILKVGDKLQQK